MSYNDYYTSVVRYFTDEERQQIGANASAWAREMWTRRAGKPPDCFWDFVEKTEAGCWIWRGPISTDGEPHWFAFGSAKRFAWMEENGSIPLEREGLHKSLHHLIPEGVCTTQLCVRPSHLVPLTMSEHARRHLTRS